MSVIRPGPKEEAYIFQAQQGDLEAFNRLVEAYQNLAYSVAFRTLQDEDAAADAAQDSFVKAYRALHTFQGGSFKSWLMRIVVNTCYDQLRSQQRHPTDSLDQLSDSNAYLPQLQDNHESPEAYVGRMEVGVLIERAIGSLPADQRLVLTLCDVHGYSYDEICEMTGWPMGTVKSRINRARSKARDYLLQYPELLPSTFRP